jgi:DNA-binding NtrC family response regulator
MTETKGIKKSILLIDDDPLVLQTLTRLLEKKGYQVRAFSDPQQAMQEAMSEDFDLVITDIRMPHIDGFQTIAYMREVRRQNSKSSPPEIFITGYSEDYAQKARNMNPYALIFKPFDMNGFLEIVERALNQ